MMISSVVVSISRSSLLHHHVVMLLEGAGRDAVLAATDGALANPWVVKRTLNDLRRSRDALRLARPASGIAFLLEHKSIRNHRKDQYHNENHEENVEQDFSDFGGSGSNAGKAE